MLVASKIKYTSTVCISIIMVMGYTINNKSFKVGKILQLIYVSPVLKVLKKSIAETFIG